MIKKHTLTLKKIEQLTPTVKGFDFLLDEPLTYKTGQWLMLEVSANGQILKRAMSIASPAYETSLLHFCVKLASNSTGGSIALHALKEEEQIQATGPFGLFTLKYPTDADIVMIATGSGISHFRAMALDLLEEKKATNQIYLLFGNRTEDETIYREFFEELAKKHSNFHFLTTLTRPDPNWKGEVGRVQQVLEKHITGDKNKHFYICGLKDMVLEMVTLLEQKGYPREHIHFERYN